jgi:2-desacetyl-2-hydroxyethyl bacteriochlorophyllide A dehydrogenase
VVHVKAVVLEGKDQIAIRDLPEPGTVHKALVKVERAGLCGTDLKIVSGAIPTNPPLILGHEIIGRVVRSGAHGLVPVDTRVLLDPGIACGHCVECRGDREYLCSNGALMGRDTHGGFAEFLEAGEDQLHPLPAGIDPDAEAVLQVLATCVHAQSRIQVFPGQAAVVLGLGVSGLLHAQLLRLRGAHPVIGVTRSGAKRAMAHRLGVRHTFPPPEATEAVRQLTNGRGADVVVESSGSADAFRQTSSLAAPGGTVLLFGTIAPNADDVPAYEWYYKELDVVSSRAARSRDYARAIELAAADMVDLAPMVTSTYPLTDAVKAFAACGQAGELKVVLDVA